MPKALIQFFREHSQTSIRRILLFAAIAGLSNALILGVVNAAAANISSGTDAGAWLLGLFFTTLAIYALSQRYIFTTTTGEIEGIIDAYRNRMVEKIRHCNLDSLDRVGRAAIFAGITRQPQVVSQTAGPLILAAQSAILIVFTMIYMAWLSIYAFLLTVVIIGVAVWQYGRKAAETNTDLHAAAIEENILFDGLTDLIDGFKEVRLNTPRSEDLRWFIELRSKEVRRLKVKVDVHLSILFIFAQITFYLLAGAMAFVLPLFGENVSAEILKTTTVVLFLIGPITSVVSASSNAAQANAAVEDMISLDAKLTEAAEAATTTGERLQSFSDIRLDAATYVHTDAADNSLFRCGPIDLRIGRGEIVFVSGGNGSGKSTMMKMLTFLYKPAAGTILLDGEPVTLERRELYQSLFSTVFFDFHLFPRPYGLGTLDPMRVDGLLDEMGLKGKTAFKNGQFDTKSLSTGQRKRLGLIIALLEDRPICLFDEWAADQDPEFRHRFYEVILPRLRDEGKTIIAVTHDDRYFGHCDRRIAMEEGRIVVEERGRGA